jgi:1-phosphofructokinase family hexose kinase
VRPILVACANLSLDRTIAVESVAPGRVHRASQVDVRAGGKGVNVVRALACVGVRATLVGTSAGRTGQAVEGHLADEGIEAVTVPVPGETRSCLAVVTPDGVTVFNEPGSPVDESPWREFEATTVACLARQTVFVCSGSFPPGAPADGAARLLEAARGHGCATLCDTSRAQLGPALQAHPDIVAPNLSEAEGLLGGEDVELVDASAEALDRASRMASELLRRGPGAVLVTAAGAGAVLATPEETLELPPLRVEALNPVGAGDCLVAGIAWGLALGLDLAVAARRGVAMAAASCETFAAGVLERARYEELLSQLEQRG